MNIEEAMSASHGMTEEELVAGLRGAFIGMNDHHVYQGIGVPLLLLQGMRHGLCLIHNLDPNGGDFPNFIKDPANQDNEKVILFKEISANFVSRFCLCFEVAAIMNKVNKPRAKRGTPLKP